MTVVKNLPANTISQETWIQSLGQKDPMEEEMTTHSSIPVWEMPGTEEPGGLQSMGSRKSHTQTHTHRHTDTHRHIDTHTHTHTHTLTHKPS